FLIKQAFDSEVNKTALIVGRNHHADADRISYWEILVRFEFVLGKEICMRNERGTVPSSHLGCKSAKFQIDSFANGHKINLSLDSPNKVLAEDHMIIVCNSQRAVGT